MENKATKNMEYWKKKNSIPGIEALADSGLTDGRAGSSPFQMTTPGSSPNKFSLLGALSGGMLGKKGWGKKVLGGDFKGAFGQAINPLSGMGLGNQGMPGGVGAGFFGGGGQPVGQPVATPAGPAVAEAPQQPVPVDPNAALQMKKSPLEQEEMMMEEKPQEERKTIAGQNIIKGEGEDEGNFYYETLEGEQIYIEDVDGIVAKNVKDGMVSDLDFSFEETEDGYYKVTGVEGESVDPDAPGSPGEPGYEPPVSPEDMIPGGVGETPIEMQSPNKIYEDGKRRKNYTY